MRRYSSSGKIGSFLVGILGFFAVIFGIVLGVAGIKYVNENDIFGGGTSDTSIITTSDDTTSENPTTSEDPITSEEPITSEVPVTSETPQPVSLSGEFPSPLFNGPYSDYITGVEPMLRINLNPSIKPATISASSYGTHLGTATKGYFLDDVYGLTDTERAIDFTINANSIRYDNTNLGYKLGFSDTTLASNITIDPVFYRDQNGQSYTYTSVIVFNFSIHNESGWEFSVEQQADLPMTIYYRAKSPTGLVSNWFVGSEYSVNRFGSVSYDLQPDHQMQFAMAYHSNSKSGVMTPLDIKLALLPEQLSNEEEIYRIQSKTNFFDEENFGIAWEVINSNVVGQYDTHTGISKDNYYYIDLKKREDFTGFYINLAIYGMPASGFGNVDAQFLQPGVNLIELTATPVPQYPDLYNFTADIVFSRPFYASDFN